MAKDYAKKYTRFNYQTPRRKKNRYLRIILVAVIGLFMVGLPFLKSAKKSNVTQQTGTKLKKKVLEAPVPKLPEPKFDFYNILPQDNINLSSRAISSGTRALPTASKLSAPIDTSAVQKPSGTMFGVTPEQAAIVEAKKHFEQEIGQLTDDVYILTLGNFTDPIQAEQLQAKALLKGFPVKKRRNLIDGKVMYQIFMGPIAINRLIKEKKRLNTAGLSAVLTKINLNGQNNRP